MTHHIAGLTINNHVGNEHIEMAFIILGHLFLNIVYEYNCWNLLQYIEIHLRNEVLVC